MPAEYTLLDIDTTNVVGVHASVEEALAVVRDSVARHGELRRLDLALRPQASWTSNTTVTLTYDWSAVPDSIRERIGFPPLSPEPPITPEHLGNSLARLSELMTS